MKTNSLISFAQKSGMVSLINEYAVPHGFSLESWMKYRRRHSISNAKFHKDNPGRKWKVVYAHSRAGHHKRGQPMKGYSKVSYNKALKRIRAEKAN